MSAKTQQTTEAEVNVNPETLTDEQIRALAEERGLIKVKRSEGQVAFEAAVERLTALKAEIFDLLNQADFGGPVEIRFGVGRDGEEFLSAIRTRQEYKSKPGPKPKGKAPKAKKKAD